MLYLPYFDVSHELTLYTLLLLYTLPQIRAYEKKKQEFLNKVDELEELWKFLEDKRSNKLYSKLKCTFDKLKKRVEKDTGLKWEELADWGESVWKKNNNRVKKVGTLAYRILKRLDPGCGFCFRLISSYPHPSQLYGWHGDHTRDKTANPSKVAETKSIPKLLDEMKKCQLRCWFCHDFGGHKRSWTIASSSYICQLDYPVEFESKSARDVFNMPSFQAFLWDAYVRGGWSGREGFTPFSYDTLEMMVWQHCGFALEDLVTWPASHWKKMCANSQNASDRGKLMNGVLYSIIKKLSGRCPSPHCLPADSDFVNVSGYHNSGIHMDHVIEGGDFEGDATRATNESLVVFLNEICGYTWATCCFCHGIKSGLNRKGIEGRVYCEEQGCCV